MTIARPLDPREAPAYCELRRRSLHESAWAFLASPEDDIACDPEQLINRISDPENVIIVASDEADPGRFIASAGVARQQRAKVRHRAIIWGVYCLPEFRGRGVGRAVTSAAIETARSWDGVGQIELCVSHNAAAAISLYESLGFEVWGRHPDAMRIDGTSYDEVHLVLRF